MKLELEGEEKKGRRWRVGYMRTGAQARFGKRVVRSGLDRSNAR